MSAHRVLNKNRQMVYAICLRLEWRGTFSLCQPGDVAAAMGLFEEEPNQPLDLGAVVV
jgi:hypothetical protein